MSFKKFPYGYEMKKGEIIISEEEAKYVRYIFNSYVSGKSMYSISIELFNNNTPYFNDTKKRSTYKVNAMLRDKRYKGADGYPAIVEPDVFEKAQRCGKAYVSTDKTNKKKVPTFEIKKETVYEESEAVRNLERNLKTKLNGNFDTEEIRDLILQLAAEKYSCIH